MKIDENTLTLATSNDGSSERPSNEDLKRWDREIVWHAFTQMAEYEPLIFDSAHGCTLVDIDGNEYIDGVSSLWCNVHGHRHPRLDAALRQQLDRVAHVTSLGASNPAAIELAKRLRDISPDGLEHVFFSDSGATAVEVALKIAFQYWRQRPNPKPEKKAFVALGEAYHGDTIGSVSVGGMELFHAQYRPLLFDVIRVPVPHTYRLPQGMTPDNAKDHYLQQVENILQQQHENIAALIIEPLVQGAAGMIMHPPGFLAGVRELTHKYNVLLIADEVAVGFGRTGTMFACEQEDVSPDLMCLAKGITGGYLPLAATLTTTAIWEAFLGKYAENKTFFHGHTYGGNPLGAAVALASLDVFEEEATLANLKPKIERLAMHLKRIAELKHVGDVRQRGMMVGIELVQDRGAKHAFDWTERRGQQVCNYVRTEGVWLRPLGNVVIIMPPLAVSLSEIDRICEAVERGIIAVTENQ